MNSELSKTQPPSQLQQKTIALGTNIVGILLSLIAACYVVQVFLPFDTIRLCLSLLILFFVVWTLPSMRGSLAVITYSLLAIAITMFIVSDASVSQWLEGITVNIAIVSIFIFVPLLGIPIRQGGFLDALGIVFEKINQKPSRLYLGTQLLTHLLGIVLNIGSVSIVHHLTKASPIQSKHFFINGINRGFATTIFWSPYFSAMALVLSGLSVNWSSIVLYLLGFVLVSFIVNFFVDFKLIKAVSFENTVAGNGENNSISDKMKAKRKIKELTILLLTIMVSVVVLEIVTPLSMVIIICLVSLIVPVLWCLMNRKQAELVSEWKSHVNETLPRMKKEVVLFFVAGFFSAAFLQTNISNDMIQNINEWFGSFKIGITYSIVLLIMVSAVLGLHPIVTVTVLVTSFDPTLLGFSKEYFAVLLLTSWGISNLISPSTATNNLLANLSGLDITDVSLRWNIKFSIILALLLPVYLSLFNI